MATIPVTRYACARCGRWQTADRMVYSRYTRQRYCRDMTGCDRRHRRLQRKEA